MWIRFLPQLCFFLVFYVQKRRKSHEKQQEKTLEPTPFTLIFTAQLIFLKIQESGKKQEEKGVVAPNALSEVELKLLFRRINLVIIKGIGYSQYHYRKICFGNK